MDVYHSFGLETDKKNLKKSPSVSERDPLVPLLRLPVNLLSCLRLSGQLELVWEETGEGNGEGRSVLSSS